MVNLEVPWSHTSLLPPQRWIPLPKFHVSHLFLVYYYSHFSLIHFIIMYIWNDNHNIHTNILQFDFFIEHCVSGILLHIPLVLHFYLAFHFVNIPQFTWWWISGAVFMFYFIIRSNTVIGHLKAEKEKIITLA